MRIAFYAPMKPPDHPLPSGDRQVARLLMRALASGGHDVTLESRFRSWEGEGNAATQSALRAGGEREAERLLASYRAKAPEERPQAWLTYHLYYKAPDWIGPAVTSDLAIPYLVAEASVAYKRAGGPWDLGHRQVLRALAQSALVITLNPGDADCLPDPARSRALPPFLDPEPFGKAAAAREEIRRRLATRLGLEAQQPWLLAVAMMREGDKLRSYGVLQDALHRLQGQSWALLVAGDGPAAGRVRQLFDAFSSDRIRFLGALGQEDLAALYAACDLLVWPAVREAYGMALLEAQASGLPALAGESPGVAAILADGETGVLVEAESAVAFAKSLGALLSDSAKRRSLAEAARPRVLREHSLEAAARRLNRILAEVAAR